MTFSSFYSYDGSNVFSYENSLIIEVLARSLNECPLNISMYCNNFLQFCFRLTGNWGRKLCLLYISITKIFVFYQTLRGELLGLLS